MRAESALLKSRTVWRFALLGTIVFALLTFAGSALYVWWLHAKMTVALEKAFGGNPQGAIEELGGTARAARQTELYLSVPYMPNKEYACGLLLECGRPPDLIYLLAHDFVPHDIRIDAVRKLGEMGPRAQSAEPALNRALGASNAALRVAAAVALGRITGKHEKTLELVSQELESRDIRARLDAAIGLYEMTGETERVLPILAEVARTAQEENAWDAHDEVYRTLGRIGGAAVPVLVEALKSGEREDRMAAADTLGEIGAQARAAIPSLEDLAKSDSDVSVRAEARNALWRIQRALEKPTEPALPSPSS